MLTIQEEYGSLDSYLWSFVNKEIINHAATDFSELPKASDESRKMCNDLKKKGFKFVGPKICYAFMQAIGMVNDHLIQCFRHDQI